MQLKPERVDGFFLLLHGRGEGSSCVRTFDESGKDEAQTYSWSSRNGRDKPLAAAGLDSFPESLLFPVIRSIDVSEVYEV